MRFAAIYASPYLDSTPCLFNLLQAISDQGHSIEVWTAADASTTEPEFEGAISLRRFDGERRNFVGWAAREVRERLNQIDAIIAIDRLGMFATAKALGFRAKKPVIYFNVELYLPPIFQGTKHTLANAAEAFLVRRLADLILTPSDERGAHLADWYRLNYVNVMTLPNSPRGDADGRRTRYLREKHRIPDDEQIALYFGSLTAANRIEELIRATKGDWPRELALICHGRQSADAEGRAYFRRLADAAPPRVVFSLDPLPPVELAEMVRSADVGIALYPTEGIGFQTMGTASGKIAQYLHSGIPVVTSDVDSLRRVFTEFPLAGGVVESAAAVPEIAQGLIESGDRAREDALKCFQSRFSFDTAFDRFYARLVDLF